MGIVRLVKNEQFSHEAKAILDSATKTIDICTYKFEISTRPDARDLNELIQILYGQAASDVRVRVLLNITGNRSGLSRLNENTGRTLKAHGIEVRYLPDNRCQHAKTLVADNCVALIGSHNWSPKSLTENYEISVVINDYVALDWLQAHFERIWDKAKKL